MLGRSDMIQPMANKPSPLVGYNTNVRHKGRLYHIQTEDLGVTRAEIVTQLFADGGRILSSDKTNYRDILDTDGLPVAIKRLMQDQHKKVFIALRDGTYDEEDGAKEADTEVLDHAAAELVEGSAKERRYTPIQVGEGQGSRHTSDKPAQPFGEAALSDKSLDEVILAYLAQDLEHNG